MSARSIYLIGPQNCDGKDLTPRLKELKLHVILFLNIPSYGSGTRPWNPGSSGFEAQRTDDGYIEVIGLTTYQLPLLQAGGHGYCLMQCKTARLVTSKTIPVQVDGEACRLLPSIIELKLRNQANMVAKSKLMTIYRPTLDKLNINTYVISMDNYENLHYDKERLKETGELIANLCLDLDTDLETVRNHINRILDENNITDKLNPEWCYLDCCTAERFFRIDRSQEQLHYVTDISIDELYVLNPQVTSPIPSIELLDSDMSLGLEPIQNSINIPDKNIRSEFRKSISAEGEVIQNNHFEESASHRGVVSSPASIDHSEYSSVSDKSVQELIEAAKENYLDKLKGLSDLGSNLLSADQSGMTALHHAASRGHKDIVRYLIAYAPTSIMDITDSDKGQTALHMAAEFKRRKICCMLVAAGANLNIHDFEKKAPKHLALQAEDKELFDYLDSKYLKISKFSIYVTSVKNVNTNLCIIGQEQFQMIVREDFETAV
ncbi:Eye-specific diacylglycerol kinase [Nymphon striatum]|nr:Eye-specific diacylglycerol kinase [Nymphon striatum]